MNSSGMMNSNDQQRYDEQQCISPDDDGVHCLLSILKQGPTLLIS